MLPIYYIHINKKNYYTQNDTQKYIKMGFSLANNKSLHFAHKHNAIPFKKKSTALFLRVDLVGLGGCKVHFC